MNKKKLLLWLSPFLLFAFAAGVWENDLVKNHAR